MRSREEEAAACLGKLLMHARALIHVFPFPTLSAAKEKKNQLGLIWKVLIWQPTQENQIKRGEIPVKRSFSVD